MRTTPSKDLRVTETSEAIDTSFRELMLEQGYERITVTALRNRARISKKTFYCHYETLDDLLAAVMAPTQRIGASGPRISVCPTTSPRSPASSSVSAWGRTSSRH